MQTFTIRDLERFSGIKPHTLRTWERRYNIPRPRRTEGKTRHYSLNDLKEILNIALLNKNGYKISYLSGLSPAETEAKANLLTGNDNRNRRSVAALLVYMHTMDTEAFESVVDDCFLAMPLQEVLDDIICAFLLKTNLLWQGNRLTEEHLVVTVMRKKIILAIEKTEVPLNPGKSVLLFLDGTRQLDLGLLYASYFLKNLGVRVIYLGNDISVVNLEMIFKKYQPDFLYTYMTRRNNFDIGRLAGIMEEYLPATKLIVSLQPGSASLSPSSDKVVCMDYESALQFLSA